MFNPLKKKPPQPILTVPVFIEQSADHIAGKVKRLWPTQRVGEREIVVNQPRTHKKRIEVSVRINQWRARLSEQGKRPLGAVRRCDAPVNFLDLRSKT